MFYRMSQSLFYNLQKVEESREAEVEYDKEEDYEQDEYDDQVQVDEGEHCCNRCQQNTVFIM